MSNKSCVTKRGLKIIFLSILDTFAKLRKVTIRFVLSVRPYGQLGSQCMDFHDIWYSSICRKFVEKIQVSWKSEKNKFYLHEYRYLFLIVFCWILLDWGIFIQKFYNKSRHHILCSVMFFEYLAIYEILLKILSGGTGHKWQYGASALHVRYQSIETHSQNTNNYCFSTATMVPIRGLNITLNLHCLSCLS